MYEILSYIPPNKNFWTDTATTSTLCTAYYTKVTLLNKYKIKFYYWYIVNVHITGIVSRAPSSLISISIGLQLHTVTQCTFVRVFSRTAQCSSQHIRYSLFPSIKAQGSNMYSTQYYKYRLYITCTLHYSTCTCTCTRTSTVHYSTCTIHVLYIKRM